MKVRRKPPFPLPTPAPQCVVRPRWKKQIPAISPRIPSTCQLLGDGKDPVDLRLYLKDAQGALTETWIYQYTPT